MVPSHLHELSVHTDLHEKVYCQKEDKDFSRAQRVFRPACGGWRIMLGVILRNGVQLLWDRASHWAGDHQLGEAGWPVSLGIHLTSVVDDKHVPSHLPLTWVVGIELRSSLSSNSKASTLPTDPDPSPTCWVLRTRFYRVQTICFRLYLTKLINDKIQLKLFIFYKSMPSHLTYKNVYSFSSSLIFYCVPFSKRWLIRGLKMADSWCLWHIFLKTTAGTETDQATFLSEQIY